MRLIILGVAIASLIIAIMYLPVKDWLIQALEWTDSLGIWGPFFVVGFYVFACILFLPGSMLTLGIGFIFGVITGTITVSMGSTLGACAAFMIGRTLARDWISQKIAAHDKFGAIDKAVGRQGFKIVLLTRLSPVFPFNLLNYAFGLTRVSLRHYALASWLGMLPGTVMYVYFGAGLRSLADVSSGNTDQGPAQQIFFWFGMVATIAVTIFVTRIARQALKQAVPENENNMPTTNPTDLG